jgi:DNA mismatch repair protein MutS
MVKNHNIINEYIELENLYKKDYDKYIILLQVGSFYELYSINSDEKKLKIVCELLNIILTKKNKSIEKISKSNPYMAGFPCVSLEKYLDTLINNHYTVIVYNQYHDKKSIKRKLDKIYSIGTYIESEKLSVNDNLIISIYLEVINNNLITGISIIDLSIGSIKLIELYNTDYNKLIEDLNKEFIIYNPKEIILTYPNEIDQNFNKLYTYLKNKNSIFHFYDNIDKLYKNITFQNEFFEKIFKNINKIESVSIIESLDLERYEILRLSLIILLKFAYNHDNNIINNLNKPNILMNKSILNLHNNALYQLNILSQSYNYKYNSLFDIINKTSTTLGKRFLKINLSEPITDINELNYRYSLINKLLDNNRYLKYENELDNILDIEKYHKKLSINKLLPFQYGRLNLSYLSIINIIKLAKKDFNNFDFNLIDTFNDYYKEYITYFNLKILELYNNNNNNNNINIFNKGIINQIDEIYNKIESEKKKLEILSEDLSKLINNDKIEIKYTDRDGYYLCLTKNRANKLKKELENIDNFKDLIFENKTQSNTYITSVKIKQISKNIIQLSEKLNNIMKIKYLEISESLFSKYYNCLNYLNTFISYIDFIKSNTKCSYKYNYIKPIITENEKSFINTKGIRHPISEQLNTDFEYITNDIDLNYSTIGCLLYGSNGVGKSTLMKSIGLNIILAQIGCFVAAFSFEYMPYNSLFTRIDHSDNLFKGLSSFESEILELKSILNFSDKNSLILGDEILNSTENISAISIISASINYFLKNNISFIFASHLHQIPNYINNNLKNKLNICHLTMDYDSVNKTFIYTRKLQSGPSVQNYGLIVAKSLLDNDYIINSSLYIQNTILNNNSNDNTKILKNNNLIEIKKSKYNTELLMTECSICKDLNIKNDDMNILETHHIIFQTNFDENNKCIFSDKSHIKKNQKSNLVNLCKFHHLEVHKNNIIINKWIKTTKGKKLDYEIKLN